MQIMLCGTFFHLVAMLELSRHLKNKNSEQEKNINLDFLQKEICELQGMASRLGLFSTKCKKRLGNAGYSSSFSFLAFCSVISGSSIFFLTLSDLRFFAKSVHPGGTGVLE